PRSSSSPPRQAAADPVASPPKHRRRSASFRAPTMLIRSRLTHFPVPEREEGRGVARDPPLASGAWAGEVGGGGRRRAGRLDARARGGALRGRGRWLTP